MENSRIHIQLQRRQLTILVPVRKNIRIMLWVLLLAVPWAVFLWILVERLQLEHTIRWAPALYMVAILLWSVVGIAGYTVLSFMFFGREKILITPDQILIEKPLVFYNRRNYYKTSDISNLRVGREVYKAKEKGIWVDRERSILQMDYPGKKVSFARGTTPEEAEWILLKIAQSGLLSSRSFAATHQV